MTLNDNASSVRPLLLVAAAAMVDGEGRVLLAQRPAHKSLGGLWEFPGGKVEAGESPEAALVRELAEELDVSVALEDLSPFAFASYSYERFHLLMPLYVVRRWRNEPQPREAQALAWAKPADMRAYAMPPADVPLVDALIARPPA